MIGSPNFARLIYDGNGSKFEDAGPEGSDAIERTFERYFESQDLASGQTAFDGRSDYGPFIDVGIPAGGLFTGAEERRPRPSRPSTEGPRARPSTPATTRPATTSRTSVAGDCGRCLTPSPTR